MKRYLRLLLGCVSLFAAGVLYAWGTLNVPLKTLVASPSVLSGCFTLTLSMFCLGGFFSGLLAKKIPAWVRMAAAAVLSGGGFCLAAQAGASSAWLYLGYGVMAGLGIGIIYNVVIASTNAWFPDKKGLSSGALMMSFGFSALLLGKAATALFNNESVGWMNTYYLIGAMLFIVTLVAGFLVRTPEKAGGKAVGSDEDMNTVQMLRRPSFWQLFVFLTLLGALGSAAIGIGRDFFEATGVKENSVLTLVGLLPVANGIGRIVSGLMFDKCGVKATKLTVGLLFLAGPALCLAASFFNVALLGIIGLFICAFFYGCCATCAATFVGSFYGMRHYALNFPTMNLTLIPASFASTLVTVLYGVHSSYVLPFAVLTGLAVVGFTVLMTVRRA